MRTPDWLLGRFLVLVGVVISAGSVIVAAARLFVTDAELTTSRWPAAGPPRGVPSFHQIIDTALGWAGLGAVVAVIGGVLIVTAGLPRATGRPEPAGTASGEMAHPGTASAPAEPQ